MAHTEKTKSIQPDSDRPLDDEQNDLFGFVDIAKRLAPSVLEALKSDGMVIGLEGPWGSGKTTLLNFLRTELNTSKPDNVHVISIAPWLSGDMSNLVGSLIEPMADILDQAELVRFSWWKRWLRKFRRKGSRLSNLLRVYGAKTGRTLAPAARFAGNFVPGAQIAGEALDLGSQYLEPSQRHPTTAETKSKIADQLSKLDTGFVVILDDLDRLEPAQALEVVRLVRSVADFPKIVYLMCYDREILAQAIKIGLKIDDGDLFLQKIVQLTFSIPLPEPFDLKASFLFQALAIFEEVTGKPAADELSKDVKNAVDREGSLLRTPREIKLALNGLRFVYPSVSSDVYFPDMCRLHLIKVANPPLYRWLEEYLSIRSVLTTGDASLSKDEKKEFGQRLVQILPADDSSSTRSIWNLRRFVPGVVKHADPAESVFSSSSMNEVSDMAVNRRLGSPVHYRYYFALTPPKTAMPENKFNELLSLAKDNPPRLAATFLDLSKQKRFSGRSWFEYVLEKIDQSMVKSLGAKTVSGFIFAICDVMDDVLINEQRGIRPLSLSIESRATSTVETCLRWLKSLDIGLFHSASQRLAADCRSMNWLVGTFFRGQIWDHGLVGNQKGIPDNWLFSEEELGNLLAVMKKRVATKTHREGIASLPDVGLYLFGWRDLSGIRSPRAWVKAFTKSDEGFLFVLEKLRTWAVSDKVYYPLPKSSVSSFLNWDQTVGRLEQLKESVHSEQVTDLLEAIELARH